MSERVSEWVGGRMSESDALNTSALTGVSSPHGSLFAIGHPKVCFAGKRAMLVSRFLESLCKTCNNSVADGEGMMRGVSLN